MRSPQDAVAAGLLAAERIDRDMGATARRVQNRARHIVDPAGVDPDVGTEAGGEFQRLGPYVDRDHAGTDGTRDHHRRQADPAAPVHGDPLPGPDTALFDHRAERRGEAASQSGRGDEIHRVGQPHEIDVGPFDGDEFGERPPGRETGLKLVVADLMVARGALRTGSARRDEGHRHPIADMPAAHVGSHGLNHARQFMAGHMRQHDVGIMAHPAVPIAAADAVGADPNNDAVGRGGRIGNVTNPDPIPGKLQISPHAWPCFPLIPP